MQRVDIQPLRRKERLLAKRLGLDDESRRDLLEAVTGHRSTTELRPDEWPPYLDRLAALAGEPASTFQMADGRGQRADGRRQTVERPYPLGNAATANQLAYVEWFRQRIEWRHADGPEAGFRHLAARVLFRGGRDEATARAWIDCQASVASLSRRQASLLLVALKREWKANPRVPAAALEAKGAEHADE